MAVHLQPLWIASIAHPLSSRPTTESARLPALSRLRERRGGSPVAPLASTRLTSMVVVALTVALLAYRLWMKVRA
jgi:hypothetical protein